LKWDGTNEKVISKTYCQSLNHCTFTMTAFSINFMNPFNGKVLGLFIIEMNVELNLETIERMCHILFTELHYILTFSHQEGDARLSTDSDGEGEGEGEGEEEKVSEGSMDAETFAQHSYDVVVRAMDHVAHLFGEDAQVIMDRNLEAYQAEAFENLIHWNPALTIGAKMTEGPRDPWAFMTFQDASDAAAFLVQTNVM
jgi:hypothetical protein